ncbi:ANTAR domain-containing response regulator [Jannaschia marina]|uniref:ANTAR domain-containing response regulator n=1 Tax=Jannaschia marina TaxID=2741674 RepID=UPI0015CB76A2|nr:ANTAR domain-containing protein [Jannaschia marina]
MDRSLSVIVVERDAERAALIAEALREAVPCTIETVGELDQLARAVRDIRPDIVLVDIADPSRDAIEEITLMSGPQDRAVALFVDRDSEGLARQAVEAGMSAYVVDGLRRERIKPILEAAIARFQLMRRMQTELEETRRALEERKVIDRAKGIVMRAKGLDEAEAYALLRKTAMDRKERLADVAQALVTAADLLG